MAIRLFDTLSRQEQLLKPAANEQFRFYCCGPTVYGPAHIGNFRTFLIQDVLRRCLEAAGLNPIHVRNITDVDDKTIRQSQEEGRSLTEFTSHWTARFHADCTALNMLAPTHEPKATEHIDEQVEIIRQLVDNGHAYAASDGSVYFKVSSCEHYGELSHLDRENLQTQGTNSAGQVNDADEYDRESVSDFALWKARKPEDGDNYWPSPWGEGRPGWHIECSAMSTKYLGNRFDLHGGGVDLCFPHHENEIAQAECATGERHFCDHWFHSAHLMVEGKKMSKSLGNFYTLADIREKGYSAMDLRYALISGHYRQQLNLTENTLKASASALAKLRRTIKRLLEKAGLSPDAFQTMLTPGQPAATSAFSPAWMGLCDDLNVPEALGELFSGLKKLDAASPQALQEELAAIGNVLFALGLDVFVTEQTESADAPEDVQALAQQRWEAKQQKDFATADTLRAEVLAKGWKILDSKDGFDLEQI